MIKISSVCSLQKAHFKYEDTEKYVTTYILYMTYNIYNNLGWQDGSEGKGA